MSPECIQLTQIKALLVDKLILLYLRFVNFMAASIVRYIYLSKFSKYYIIKVEFNCKGT